MEVLIALALSVLFAFALRKQIKRYAVSFYIVAIAMDVLFLSQVLFGVSREVAVAVYPYLTRCLLGFALFAVVSGGYSAKQTDFPRNAIANAWRSIDFVNLRKRDRLWITCASLLRRQQIPLMHRSLNTPRTANLSRLSATPAIFLNRRMAKRSGKICWKVVNAADALRAKSFWPSVWMPPSLTILIMSISVRC